MMPRCSLLALVALSAGHAAAAPLEQRQAAKAGGTGPYPANYFADPGLKDHTVYMPTTVPAGVKLPVLVWGEGGCMPLGTMFPNFLTEIASHGFLVLANGPPAMTGTASTTSKMLRDSVDYITAKAGVGNYSAVDASRIAAAGQSCGGLEALDMKDEARVAHIGVFNSGYLQNPAQAATIKKSVFYFLGGSTDVAYANGERDYKALPAGTPSWKGNMDVGHQATYAQQGGGKFGAAAVRWLQWVLQGNQTAAAWFTGAGAAADGWAVEMKDLDKMKV